MKKLLVMLLVMVMTVSIVGCTSSEKGTATKETKKEVDSEEKSEEEVEDDAVMRLETLYLTAKKYDVLINDYFKFVNYYYLHMNRTYMKNQ